MDITITIVVVGTALASTFGASLAMFLIQRYYDRRLQFYFNSRIEELKANLSLQGDIRNQITSQRLEIYPLIAESVYRLRNDLRELNERVPLTLEGAVAYLRLAEQYTEQIYSARFFLELDQLFEMLHEYKEHVLTAKNLLLDWIYLVRDQPSVNKRKIDLVLAQLQGVYRHLEMAHKQLIQSLIRLTPA